MIIGGDGLITSIELFNWQSGKQCKLGDLPYGVGGHSGIIMNGTVAFCGGNSEDHTDAESRCYKFNKATTSWTQASIQNYTLGCTKSGVANPGPAGHFWPAMTFRMALEEFMIEPDRKIVI
jgi:hypothetical protein